MKKFFLFLFGAATLFAGCTKEIIDDGDGNTGVIEDRNVELRLFYNWNGQTFYSDSTYMVAGERIQIENLDFLFSNFHFAGLEDTIQNESVLKESFSTLSMSAPKLGRLEPGAYYGKLYWTMGLDSLTNSRQPSAQSTGSPLSTAEYREGIGYNMIRLSGVVISQPDTSKPEVRSPFEWKVATSPFAYEFDLSKSFSMGGTNSVVITANVDLSKIFIGLDPVAVPFIQSDPDDAVDYNRAGQLRKNVVEEAISLNL